MGATIQLTKLGVEMKKFVQARLSAMMFLQFFIWAVWYTVIAIYMAANGMEDLTHWPFTVNPIGAIVAPLFVGLIAHRYFATEKALGVLHILGGICMFFAPSAVRRPVVFLLLLLAHNICYTPAMRLANPLSFHSVVNQVEEFPLIRVFGAIGWMIAG